MAQPDQPSSLGGFLHRFESDGSPRTTLLLLHGTGGNEHDLLGLGRTLLPGAALLAPRGPVSEMGMPRFFRRLAEGVFDEADVRRRASELAAFVSEAANRYRFDAQRVVAVGYSNGANIAAATLLLHPEVLAAAVLFRAMPPLTERVHTDLQHRPVLLSEGRSDALVSVRQAEQLAAMLRDAGAEVSLAWQEGGHGLVAADVDDARAWLGDRGFQVRDFFSDGGTGKPQYGSR